MRPNNGGTNAAVTLLSNSTEWYVMSCTDGVSLNLDTQPSSYSLVEKTHVTVTSNTDGIGLNPTIIPTSGSAIFYTKLGVVSPWQNGLVITTRDNAFLGGTTNRRTWVGDNRNRSAGSVLGTYIGETPIFFLLSYFVGI